MFEHERKAIVPRPSKVQDAAEIKRWIEEGRTYKWMAQQYLEKYNIEVVPSFFGNFRQRMGLPPRIIGHDELIPWEVLEKHRYLWPAQLLRMEGRRRAGVELTPSDLKSLNKWLKRLKDDNVVVHYDPETEQGWWYFPREESDTDIIREPKHTARKRRSVAY